MGNHEPPEILGRRSGKNRLAKALEQQGKTNEAAKIRQQLQDACQYADIPFAW